MHRAIKITSLVVFGAICSACAEPETPDHTRTNVSTQSPKDEAQLKNDEAKADSFEKTEGSEIRSAESHTHGDASLAIVLEETVITVELDTPLYNLLGFEHEADTAAQKATVLKAETVLSKGSSLFIFNSEAGCSILHDTISVELGHHEDEGEHIGHEDDHHDDHKEEGTNDESHKDVVLQYAYNCLQPKSLKDVTINLFEHFENFAELDLVYLGPNTQKQMKLSAAKPRMDLTR